MSGSRKKWLRKHWIAATDGVHSEWRKNWYWKQMKKNYRPGMTGDDVIYAIYLQYPRARTG